MVDILCVCEKHYIGLVVRQRIADYVPERFQKCWMFGCGLPSYRRVLLRDDSGSVTKVVKLLPGGVLWEEIAERRVQ